MGESERGSERGRGGEGERERGGEGERDRRREVMWTCANAGSIPNTQAISFCIRN